MLLSMEGFGERLEFASMVIVIAICMAVCFVVYY